MSSLIYDDCDSSDNKNVYDPSVADESTYPDIIPCGIDKPVSTQSGSQQDDDSDDSDERGDYVEIDEEELPDLDKLLDSNKEVPLPQAVRKSKHQFSILKGMYDRFKSKIVGTRDKSNELSIGSPVLVANQPRAKVNRRHFEMSTEEKSDTDKEMSVGVTGAKGSDNGPDGGQQNYEPYDPYDPNNPQDESDEGAGDNEDCEDGDGLIYDVPYQDHDFGKQNKEECESLDNEYEESFPKQDDQQVSLPPPVHCDKKIQKVEEHDACNQRQTQHTTLVMRGEEENPSFYYMTVVDDTNIKKEEVSKSHTNLTEGIGDNMVIEEKMDDDDSPRDSRQYDDARSWVNPELRLSTQPGIPAKSYDISGKSKNDHKHHHQTDVSIEPNLTTEPPKLYPKPASIIRKGKSGEGMVSNESSNDDEAVQYASPMKNQIDAKHKPSRNEHICDSSNTQDNQSLNDPSVGKAKYTTKQGWEPTNDGRPVRELSIAEVGEVLQRLKLSKYVAVFEEEQISGEILMDITQDIFESDLGMRRLDAIKLNAFIKKGHIPK